MSAERGASPRWVPEDMSPERTDGLTVKECHARAKQSGDQLRAYIVSISSAATGMFYLSLSQDGRRFSVPVRWAIGLAMFFFALTVMLTLVELAINARRFYETARQLDSSEPEWARNDRLKRWRMKVLWSSYATMGIGIVATLASLLLQLSNAGS